MWKTTEKHTLSEIFIFGPAGRRDQSRKTDFLTELVTELKFLACWIAESIANTLLFITSIHYSFEEISCGLYTQSDPRKNMRIVLKGNRYNLSSGLQLPEI